MFKKIKFNNQKLFGKKGLKAVILFLFIFFFSVQCVKAETISPGLSVSPHTFDLVVSPGETRAGKIRIGNKSQVPLPVSVKAMNFFAGGEEGEMIFDETEQDISFTSRKWIEVKKPNFILEAGETRTIDFIVSVPLSAEPGGHYATLVFEPQLPSFYFEESTAPGSEPLFLDPLDEKSPVQARVIPAIGVLFLFSVQTFALDPYVGQSLQIVEFSLPKEERLLALENFIAFVSRIGNRMFFTDTVQAVGGITIIEKPPEKFILRIKNNDIYHVKPSGKILIYDFFGKKVGESEIIQKTILPGTIRKFPIEFFPETPEGIKWLPAFISDFLIQNLFIGRYRAKIELEAKSSLSAEVFQPEFSTILTFFSFPWQFWLSFILILALVIGFVIKYKKRIVLAIKALFFSAKN